MAVVHWDERPSLRRPVLVAAFEGWNDAADAASTAASYLAADWGARPFATVDPEEFYDFTEVRPTVRIIDGLTRTIEWPTNTFATSTMPGADRDVVFLHGVEPQLKWRTFTEAVVEVVKGLGCELAVTLGALINDVPHTRPVRVTGSAADGPLAAELGLVRSRYEGPTGITGVLHDALSAASIPSASLWASVPHYIARTPSPVAALALVERCVALLGTQADTTELAAAAATYRREVDEVVDADPEATAYVRTLEEADDEEVAEPQAQAVPPPRLVSGADLAAEAERFLRDHGQP